METFIRPLLFTLALSVLVPFAAAQEPSPKGYEPQVGQMGKDVVWVPMPGETVEKMLDLGKVTAADFVVDLGSGDGRTVIAAAKRGADRKSTRLNSSH